MIEQLGTHKQTHTGHKPHQCDTCKKKFSCLSNLTTHKRTHTGDKPYECDVCHKIFSDPRGFAKHKRTHTGHKPYECDVCKKRFSQSSHLATHKKHIPETNLLNVTFATRESHKLTRHKISAHKIKQCFECAKCKKTFTQRKSLKQGRN